MNNELKYVLALIVMLFFAGCSGDSDTPENGSDDNGYVTVTFALETPGNDPATYTRITVPEEKAVANFDVLIFDEKDNTFVAHATGKVDNPPGTFKADLKKGDGYCLVVLANLAGRVCYGSQTGKDVADYVAYYTSATTPALKDNMLASLIFSDINGFGLTTHPVGGGFSKFPLWGETANVVVSEYTRVLPVKMLRAVARIDIKTTVTNFTIEEAYLYNYSTRGLAAPLPGSYTPNTQNPDTSPNADITALSLPAVADGGPGTVAYRTGEDNTNNRLMWEAPTKKEFESTIYTLEAPKTDGTNAVTLTKATALVVGVSYNSGNTSYYRIDLRKKDGNYIDILRNYCYKLTITGISEPGEETPDEAFDKPIKIEARIDMWIEGKPEEITCF